MDKAHPSTKTDREHLMKENLGRYCPKMISIRLHTWVSPVNWAPYAVMMLKFFQNHITHTAIITYQQ